MLAVDESLIPPVPIVQSGRAHKQEPWPVSPAGKVGSKIEMRISARHVAVPEDRTSRLFLALPAENFATYITQIILYRLSFKHEARYKPQKTRVTTMAATNR